MKRMALTAVGLFFALAVGVGVLALVQPAEPSYRGLAAAEWFEQFRGGDTNALTAFRQMGTNAVPFLIHRLHTQSSQAERWYVTLWQKVKPAWRTKLPPPPATAENALLAMGLLGELGPMAGAAVPAVCSVLVTPPTNSVTPGGPLRFVKLPNRIVPGGLTSIYLSNESLRYQAANTLAAIGSDRPEPLLAVLEVATNPRADFFFGAMPQRADWTVATRKALPELVKATSSPNQNVRSVALGLLGKHGLTERPALLALARASVSESGANANNAAAYLGRVTNHFEIAVAALVASLGATNAGNSVGTPLDGGLKLPNHFHGEAARALVRLHPRSPLVKSALLEALAHPQPGVRAGAAHTVGALGMEMAEAEPQLRALHSVETNAPAQFHQAYAVLRLSGDARLFMPHILATLTAPSENSRWGALGLLAQHGAGHEDVVPRLMEVAEKDPAERVRARMATVLGLLGSQAKTALPVLRRMLTDEHIFVREAAEAAIRKIKASRSR